jgi:hypothetical protein
VSARFAKYFGVVADAMQPIRQLGKIRDNSRNSRQSVFFIWVHL